VCVPQRLKNYARGGQNQGRPQRKDEPILVRFRSARVRTRACVSSFLKDKSHVHMLPCLCSWKTNPLRYPSDLKTDVLYCSSGGATMASRRQTRQHSLRRTFVREQSVLAHDTVLSFGISPREILQMNQDGLTKNNTVRVLFLFFYKRRALIGCCVPLSPRPQGLAMCGCFLLPWVLP